MKTCEIDFFGKQITLPVIFDCYDDETITNNQKEALNCFLLIDSITDISKTPVLSYLRYHLKQEISETEVLKCITPKAIYVCRDASDRKIAILCDSMVDDEHGIALLFINEKCQGMIQQDEIV